MKLFWSPQTRAQRAIWLLEETGSDSWQVTALGRRFLNDLQAEFLPERELD